MTERVGCVAISQKGFLLPQLYAYGALAAVVLAFLLGAAYWHHAQVITYSHKVELRLTQAHESALAQALLAQKEQDNANQALLKAHIQLLAKSRNSSLLDAQNTARIVAGNSPSLDSLLDTIAKSDASCLTREYLPSTPGPGPNTPPASPVAGSLLAECASSLRQMAESADSLSDRIRALQGYTDALTPFFEPAP